MCKLISLNLSVGLLITSIVLFGCSEEKTNSMISTPVSIKAQPVELPTITLPTPQLAVTNNPQNTLSFNSIPSPRYKFNLLTYLSQLEPDDYLLYRLPSDQKGNRGEFGYTLWNGNKSGRLLLIENTSAAVLFNDSVLFLDRNWNLWIKDASNTNWNILAGFNLQNQEVFQHQFTFTPPCKDLSVFSTFHIPQHISKNINYVNLSGSDCGESREKWLAIFDVKERRIINIQTMPNQDFDQGNWLDSQSMEILHYGSKDYCIFRSPDWLIRCQKMPFKVKGISPDNKWTTVTYSNNSNGQINVGIMDAKCLSEQDPCEIQNGNWYSYIHVIPITDFTFLSWSPNSQNLLIQRTPCLFDKNLAPVTDLITYNIVSWKILTQKKVESACLFSDVVWSSSGSQFALYELKQDLTFIFRFDTLDFWMLMGYPVDTFTIPLK